MATIVGLTLINVWGTKLSTAAQIALTGIPIVALAAAAVWGMATTSPVATDVKGPAGSPGRVSFGRAVLAVYFSYAGWNAIAYVGGEMERPARTIPASLLGGTALVTALYVLLAGAFVYVLGLRGVAEATEVGTRAAEALGGPRASYAATALVAVALVGSLNATILAGGRVGWAMARRGALVAAVGTLSPCYATCTEPPPAFEEAVVEVDVDGGAYKEVEVACPSDDLVAFGGGIDSIRTGEPETRLQHHGPRKSASGDADGWRIGISNEGSQSEGFDARVLCADATDGYDVISFDDETVAAGEFDTTSVECVFSDQVVLTGGMQAPEEGMRLREEYPDELSAAWRLGISNEDFSGEQTVANHAVCSDP